MVIRRRPPSEKPEWQFDEKGRKFYLEAGIRVWDRVEDRNAALEETYKHSPVVLAWMELEKSPANTLAAVMEHVATLARAFAMERGQGPLAESYFKWQTRHFGRQLEPSARKALLFEIAKVIPLEEGGRRFDEKLEGKLFRDVTEQRRYENAARVMALDGFEELPLQQQLGSIAARAGHMEIDLKRKLSEPVKAMPKIKPLSEAEYNARLAMLRKQAEEERRRAEEEGSV